MISELGEVASTSCSAPSQEAQEVTQSNEEQEQEPYGYNYEEYGYPMYNQSWDY